VAAVSRAENALRSASPRSLRALAALLLGSVGGCLSAGAHYVQEGDNGGVVGIPNNTNVWPTYYRSKAEKLMAQMCPEGYEITGEQTVPVHSRDARGVNDNPRWDYFGGLQQRAPQETEYQISFRCAPAPTEIGERRP
jgi:hypothetical protein